MSIPDGFDSIFPTIRDFRISSPATLIFKDDAYRFFLFFHSNFFYCKTMHATLVIEKSAVGKHDPVTGESRLEFSHAALAGRKYSMFV